MQIICISRESVRYGRQLAEKLAQKLGYACVSREELTDLATAQGIPVGKIETAILKRQNISEQLALDMDRFKAFISASLCGRAISGGIVYHGRTGHLVLPGLTHVLRVRAIADFEERVTMNMRRMNLAWEKARAYTEDVDEDRRRWARFMYNVNWDNPALYDITINSAHLSVENSATLLTQMAQLPEFQPTPASRRVVKDLLLGTRCRLALGKDERTRDIKVTVSVKDGDVSVVYLPRHARQAPVIPSVLEGLEGMRSLVCTVATTNILYIQERFDPQTESFGHLVEVAEKWNAAVELLRLVDDPEGSEREDAEPLPATGAPAETGGILEDSPDMPDCEDQGCGVPETLQRLIQVGRAGAVRTLVGDGLAVAGKLARAEQYSLVVVGDVFLSRGAAVRKRLKRDLVSLLNEQMRIPVIGTEDLKEQYLFGAKQWISMVFYAAATVLLYAGVFYFQEGILEFLAAPGTTRRILSAVVVGAFAPFAAIVIGGFAHNALKLVKLE
jgi:cytidylate kinase